MGDFNWVTPDFLAFASPQHQPTAAIHPSSPQWAALPKSLPELHKSNLPVPFKNVLSHFTSKNIGLVVRLNSELYSPSYFTALGIQHLDMIFDDGTCPPLVLVRKFVNLAHEMINVKNRGIAVHCKAGLGRTGCLIGAYLIYRHGFTANEVIAFMRFMRPGMVVGPQQHWLHLNQHTFREWWFEDTVKSQLMSVASPATPTRAKSRYVSNGQTFTPPNGSQRRAILGEIETNDQQAPSTVHRESVHRDSIGVHDDNLPAPTPGQPRKTSKIYGSGIAPSRYRGTENEPFNKPDTEIVSMHRSSHGGPGESESEEEFQLRMLARRPSRSPGARSSSARSPQGKDKKRSVSCTTTTTTVKSTKQFYPDGESDIENHGSDRPKTPGHSKSGSGAGALSIGKQRSPSRKASGGVRKTSGRVGSVNLSSK